MSNHRFTQAERGVRRVMPPEVVDALDSFAIIGDRQKPIRNKSMGGLAIRQGIAAMLRPLEPYGAFDVPMPVDEGQLDAQLELAGDDDVRKFIALKHLVAQGVASDFSHLSVEQRKAFLKLTQLYVEQQKYSYALQNTVRDEVLWVFTERAEGFKTHRADGFSKRVFKDELKLADKYRILPASTSSTYGTRNKLLIEAGLRRPIILGANAVLRSLGSGLRYAGMGATTVIPSAQMQGEEVSFDELFHGDEGPDEAA